MSRTELGIARMTKTENSNATVGFLSTFLRPFLMIFHLRMISVCESSQFATMTRCIILPLWGMFGGAQLTPLLSKA